MYKIVKIFFIGGVVIFIIYFSIINIGLYVGDWRVGLPNGYQLVRADADTIVICDKRDTQVVPAKITGIRICNDYVIGKIQNSINLNSKLVIKTEYFTLDCTTGMINIGEDLKTVYGDKFLLYQNYLYYPSPYLTNLFRLW